MLVLWRSRVDNDEMWWGHGNMLYTLTPELVICLFLDNIMTRTPWYMLELKFWLGRFAIWLVIVHIPTVRIAVLLSFSLSEPFFPFLGAPSPIAIVHIQQKPHLPQSTPGLRSMHMHAPQSWTSRTSIHPSRRFWWASSCLICISL